MKEKSAIIFCTHGTYGRDDDIYGALLASNTALAKGMRVTLVLIEDGVLAAKKNQNPAKIGLINNLNELKDFVDLGGKLITEKISLEERGLTKNELLEESEIMALNDISKLVEEHDISLTF